MAETIEDLQKKLREQEEENASLRAEIKECKEEIEELEEGVAADDLVDAVNAIVDLIDRPVATLNASLPATPAAARALINLLDASGRKL